MENSREIDGTAFGGLFQLIMCEMKNSSPLWEDLTTKSTKLHACLRATIQAVSAFLDAFQKIADAATAAKGATKDIGTSLTRICLRHKTLESKLKSFTASILDCLIIPLQEKLEEWKKCTAQLDKEHAKEYKKGRNELKKRSLDTLRLHKKYRKGTSGGGGTLSNGGNFNSSLSSGLSNSFSGGTLPRSHHHSSMSNSSINGNSGTERAELGRVLEAALKETEEKRALFESGEKQAIRTALIEQRSRFCHFVNYLKPVIDDEISMLSELNHVQEAMLQLEKHASEPYILPPASEQVIEDLKGSCDSGTWSFTTPPSSPSSLGSRKSSMCSISSTHSSSSSSVHSPTHPSHPPHPHYSSTPQTSNSNITYNNKKLSKMSGNIAPVAPLRYSSLSSQDSGFMSQEGIYSQLLLSSTSFYSHHPKSVSDECGGGGSDGSSNSSTPSSPYPPGPPAPLGHNSNVNMHGGVPATWPNLQDSIQFQRAASAIMAERPHTISTAYERGHQRPPLTVYTFQPPPGEISTPQNEPEATSSQNSYYEGDKNYDGIYGTLRGTKNESRPPVPKRCSSLERPPQISTKNNNSPISNNMGPPLGRTVKKSISSSSAKKGSTGSLNKAEPALPDFNQPSPDMIVPQPVYVNMHELNQMASAKLLRQQEEEDEKNSLELPPPPPELMSSKNENGGGGGGGGVSVCSSGYGSQSQIVSGDEWSGYYYGNNSGSNSSTSTLTSSHHHSQPQQILTSHTTEVMGSSKTSSGVCSNYGFILDSSFLTLPRKKAEKETSFAQTLSRSSTFRASVYGYLGRGSRSSISSNNSEKPLPPVRRSSSISASTSPTPYSSNINNFTITQNQNINISTNNSSYMSSSQIYSNSGSMEQFETFEEGEGGHIKRMSVADTIKTLTQKNHQPLSPNMVRRSQSLNRENDRKMTEVYTQQSTPPPKGKRQHVGATQQITNQIPQENQQNHQQQQSYYSQQLQNFNQQNSQPQPIHHHLNSGSNSNTTNNTPRNARRFSEELLKSTATFVQNRVLGAKTPPPIVRSKEIFVQTLNAKLSQMRVGSPPKSHHQQIANQSKSSGGSGKWGGNRGSYELGRGSRVRQWISAKTTADPASVRESLLDQIRRGTKLREVRGTNDRSAPKLRS